jgi:hypothetical protein
MSTTGDLPGLPGTELDDNVDDAAFDELARRAGAALRRPAPADGVTVIAARQRRQQALKATIVGGAAVAAAIGALVIVANRDDPHTVPAVDSPPTSLPASTTPSPTTSLADSSPGTTSPAPSTTADPFPNLTTTFVSPTYGFSFKYLDRGGLTPATVLWDPVNQQADGAIDHSFDAVETGMNAYFGAASAELPDEVSIDEWVDEYVSPGGCGVPRSQQEEITIDGLSGTISACPNGNGVGRIDATVVAGGRLYLFSLLHTRSDARAFFEAWVATIDLTPETAAVP